MTLTQEETTFDKDQLAILVRAAQDGERHAFDELFNRYHRAVYATVYRRLGNDAEAQELVQEVFIQAMRKIDQLQNPVAFGGWLRAIAARMAINRAMRTHAALGVEPDQFAEDCHDRETPLGRMLAQEEQVQIHRGLDRLTDLDRNTLVAFYFQGRSLLEMSDEFASPVGTIKRRLHVARKRLAKELSALAPA
jgi:RNA polymerase sigma-70 factor (ECF subfamily)